MELIRHKDGSISRISEVIVSNCSSSVVKVRRAGGGGSAPLLPFEPPAIV